MFLIAKFIFVLICINNVICKKEPCNIEEDSKCLTESCNIIYPRLINGESIAEPSDPLHRDVIEVHQPNVWFKLTNASLSGMANCHVELMKIMKKDQKYECHLRCPHLTLDSEYDIKGVLASVFLQGKGTCKVDFYDYNIFFEGSYIKKIQNGKEYMFYINKKLYLELREKAHYDFKNLFNGDKKKSDAVHKDINKNWKLVDKPIGLAVIQPFMDKYVDNVNVFSGGMSIVDFFSLS